MLMPTPGVGSLLLMQGSGGLRLSTRMFCFPPGRLRNQLLLGPLRLLEPEPLRDVGYLRLH